MTIVNVRIEAMLRFKFYHDDRWDKVIKSWPSKICGRQTVGFFLENNSSSGLPTFQIWWTQHLLPNNYIFFSKLLYGGSKNGFHISFRFKNNISATHWLIVMNKTLFRKKLYCIFKLTWWLIMDQLLAKLQV